MTADINTWRQLVKDAVESIADEALQRRAWFGAGPEVYSPTEAIEQFFSSAAIEEFLTRPDNGFDDAQTTAGWRLVRRCSYTRRSTHRAIHTVSRRAVGVYRRRTAR